MTQKSFDDFRFISQFFDLERIVGETNGVTYIELLLRETTVDDVQYLLLADNAENDLYPELAGSGAIVKLGEQIELVLRRAFIRDYSGGNNSFEAVNYRGIGNPRPHWRTTGWNEMLRYFGKQRIIQEDYTAKLVLTPRNTELSLINYKNRSSLNLPEKELV